MSTKNLTESTVPSTSFAIAVNATISPVIAVATTPTVTVGAWLSLTTIFTVSETVLSPLLSLAIAVNKWVPLTVVYEFSYGEVLSTPTDFPSTKNSTWETVP